MSHIPLTKDIHWIAGMDEELALNFKYIDDNGDRQITDLNGYSGEMEIRKKDTDAVPILVITASIDTQTGRFLYEADQSQTQILLTSKFKTIYQYRITTVEPSGNLSRTGDGILTVTL